MCIPNETNRSTVRAQVGAGSVGTFHCCCRDTVLVVDDQDAIRQIVAEWLEHEGHDVVRAESPEAALELADELPGFGWLVTDFEFPQSSMHGVGLAHRMRIEHPALRMLLMTGAPWAATAACAEFGFTLDIMAKPFSRNELLGRIRGTSVDASGWKRPPAKAAPSAAERVSNHF